MLLSTNKNKRIIHITSFIIALSIGVAGGIFIGKGKNDANEALSTVSDQDIDEVPTSTYLTGLLVGVDDINLDSPTLESAWWLSYNQKEHEFHLMPLYPILPINAPENLLKYLAPHPPINLSSLDISTIQYNDLFMSYKLNWDFTLLMDRFALDTMLDSYAEYSIDTSRLKIEYLDSLNPTIPGKDPSAALSYQRKLFEILCDDLSPILTDTWIDDLLNLDTHYRTDLDLTDILKMRDGIQESFTIPTCIFSWQ